MPDFRRKSTRLKDFNYKNGYGYFITICTYENKPYFLNLELSKFVESTIDYRVKLGEVIIYCYCIMPNHIHILLELTENYKKDLSVWLSSFKRFISKEVKSSHGILHLWQKNYYDHIARTDESLSKIAEYILNNPVRKNMVKHWTEYPFSKIKL